MLSKTEKYLIESIQKGDYHAYEILFKTYYSSLCALGRSYVHSTETAEDLVADVFVKIWEQPAVLLNTKSLKGYLICWVRNSCINYLTRKHKQFQYLDAITCEKLTTIVPELMQGDPSEDFMTVEFEDKITEAISTLPPECRKIFLLSRREELSHREIAEQLNISVNTVKVQVFRALSKIREALKKYLD